MWKQPMSSAMAVFVVVVVLMHCCTSTEAVANCTCSGVSSNGEYCGTELNRINGGSCERHQYLCGPSNRNGAAPAVVVKQCARGSECDVSRGGYSNACLADIDCHCPSSLRSDGRTRYCGDQLSGRDCSANVVFTCGTSYPNPIDACPRGCRRGRCI